MATWFPENAPRILVEGFETSFTAWRNLIGKVIRIHWPDSWGDAFYTGKLSVVSPMDDYEDVTSSTWLRLELDDGEIGIALPDGIELDVWVMGEVEQ